MTAYPKDKSSTYRNYRLDEPLLSSDEERSLGQRVRAGIQAAERLAAGDVPAGESVALRRLVRDGERAKDRFVRANLRLVVSFASKHAVPAGVEMDDVVQAGNIGLIRAVEKFDPDRGWRFSTYASFWIRQAIQRSSPEWYSVTIPSAKVLNARSAQRHEATLTDEESNVLALLNVGRLDTPIGEGDARLIDLLPSGDDGPDVEAEQTFLSDAVREALDVVFTNNPRWSALDRQLLEYTYLQGDRVLPASVVAAHFGMDPARVRRRLRVMLDELAGNSTLAELVAA